MQAEHGLAFIKGEGDLVSHAMRRYTHFCDQGLCLADPCHITLIDLTRRSDGFQSDDIGSCKVGGGNLVAVSQQGCGQLLIDALELPPPGDLTGKINIHFFGSRDRMD